MGIQINGNTNNINAGIGSLSIEDLREIDIVGVATASNFKTGVSDLHSVGLTLSGGQLDVGNNIKLGNAGVITATSYRGDGSQLTGITGTTINNNATTKFITGTNNANELDCEANLSYNNNLVTFASSNLLVNKSTSPTISVTETAGSKSGAFRANTDGVLLRSLGNYPLIFDTNQTERARIDGSGRLLIGTTTEGTGSGDNLTISDSGNMGMTLRSTDSNYCNIYFSDATSGTAEYEGYISYNHGTNSLEFATNHIERLRIDSSGRVVIGGTSAYIGGAALAVLGTGTTPNTYGCVAIGRVGANVTNNTAIANIRLNGGSIGTRRGAEINAFADANWSDGSSQPTRLTIGTTGSSSTSATQRLIINSSGDIYTAQNGTPFSWPSNPGHVIYSDGEYRSTSANGTHIRCNRMNGDGHVAQWYRGQTNMVGYISITSSGTGYGSGSSDERTKKNIEAWDENILDKFKSLTPKKFNFNWEDDSVSKHKGYIAQNEFEKFPEAYPKNNLTDCDNEYHMFVPTDMTVYLMKGLKEAAEKIEQLEQDNLALRARVTNLEGN
tara:strand:- start:53 stop:1720 length:1668 start_codon:yes stop_codon:yes gene_type:complete